MPRRHGYRSGERITRENLNDRLKAPPATRVTGPRVYSRNGDAVFTDEEEICFRITAVGTSPTRYGWQEVVHDKFTGAWTLGPRTGGVDSDPAYEANGEVLTAGDTVYRARRSRSSGAWLFFLRNRKPNWPFSLWGFHGLIEFGYLDVWDSENEVLKINSAVVDKEAIQNIQAFRVKDFTEDDHPARFRGASGWYFQASASTATVNVNPVTQDERDLGAHEGWGNVVEAWEDGDLGSYDDLFLGTPTFGGYYYGDRDDTVTTTYDGSPGPIRMSYIYGAANATLNNRLTFEWQGSDKARLTGTTPAIPDWASSGSLVPDDATADCLTTPGADTLIPIDGLRAIRVRVFGWHAHFADHAIKPSHTFEDNTFPAGMNFVWRENAAAFAFDDGDPLGDFTPQYSVDPVTSAVTYGDKIEFTGFHQFYFSQWAEGRSIPGRYDIQLRSKVWYLDDEYAMPPFRPDPYRVLLNVDDYYEPDEVILTEATTRQTVHLEGDPIFNVDPTYADNVGYVIDFSQTVDRIAYIHQEWTRAGRLLAAQFWGGREKPDPPYFAVRENVDNTILFTKLQTNDLIPDNFEAALICTSVKPAVEPPMPRAYVAVRQFRSTGGHDYSIVRNWNFAAGTEFDVLFSDDHEITDADLEFTYEPTEGLDAHWAEVTVREPDQAPRTHRTWFRWGDSDEWEEFCQVIYDSSGIWNQFGSLITFEVEGIQVTGSSAGTYTGSVTVSWELSPALVAYLADNTDVEISYAWDSVCTGVPKLPDTGSGTITASGSTTVTFSNNCGGDNREATFVVTMTTPTNRALFDSECTPYGQNIGVTSKSATFTFVMEP